MNKFSLLMIISMLSGCAHNKLQPNILEQGFGGNLEYGGITFLDGPWFSPGSKYGYHISDKELKIAHATKAGGVETHVIDIASCHELELGINTLKIAAFESSKVAFGIIPAKDPEILVMDGPSHSLSIYSDAMWGSITLEGGGTTSYTVPWVDAAFEIGQIADRCDDTGNKLL